ncbi:MAG: hypothetical protein ACI81L_002457 [Verrucomicrobiales bacterium]|jgi:hypothetical protein
MGIAKKYIEKKATQRIPTPLLDAAGKALIEGVDRAVVSRWDRAQETARSTAPGASPAIKARAIANPVRRSMTALGAAAGATAAAPGVGTSAAVGTLIAELGVVALRTSDMVMAIGAAYGHDDAGPEERRAWILAVLAFGDDAAEEFSTLARDIGLKVGEGHAIEIAGEAIGGGAGQVATIDALRRINTTLVSQVLKKWGARRGAATIGKLLPFGIGAAVGGSANFFMMREFAKQADQFFSQYDRDFVLGLARRGTVDNVDAIDVEAREAHLPPPPPANAQPH